MLDDAHVAAAEELILGAGLAGKTPGQIGKIAARAVVTVDPGGARKRREQAEQDDARIRFWRERAGTSALAAYGLPTDAALQANASIGQRADEYKKVGLDGTMDQLRVLAYLDILNGTTAADRITQAQAEAARAGTEAETAQAGTSAQAHPRMENQPPAPPAAPQVTAPARTSPMTARTTTAPAAAARTTAGAQAQGWLPVPT